MEGYDWDQIADGSGRGIINDFSDFQSPDMFFGRRIQSLRHGGEIYRQILNADWRWYGQKHYVEFWLEKHAITGTVAALVGDRYVRVGFNKGNPGWRYMRDNCERLKGELYTTGPNGERIREKSFCAILETTTNKAITWTMKSGINWSSLAC